jgi:hypothetical protein
MERSGVTTTGEAETVGELVDLKLLAQARFGSLGEGEIKLLGAASRGTTAYCGPSEQDEHPGNNPADSDNWTKERQIRADLIRWICIDQAAKNCVDPRGIRLCGARIIDILDLSFVTVQFPLRFSRCSLPDDLNLNYIDIPSIDLTGTWLHSLNASHATVKGSMFLKSGFFAQGRVQLLAAKIGGSLECDGGRFLNPANAAITESGMAINAEAIKVNGSVFLRNDFLAEGQVRLFRAEIGGDLSCDGGKFQNPPTAGVPGSGMALNAEAIKVTGSVLLRNGFAAEGGVRLFAAQIGRNVECDSGKFQNPASAEIPGGGWALHAEAIKVSGGVFLRNNFSSEGNVSLFGAEIGGNLSCDGGKFQNPPTAGFPGSGMALNGEGIKVTGAVLLRKDFSAEGEVRLFGAEIGRNFSCDGGKFQNPPSAETPGSGMALNAEAVKVAGSVLFRNNFLAEGRVRLFAAHIGRSLECDGGKFQNPVNPAIPGSGMALHAEAIKVTGGVFFRNNFSAEGQVWLFGAEIGGNLICDGGKFMNPPKAEVTGSGMALHAEAIKVTGTVLLRENFSAQGQVRLFAAQIGGNFSCSGGKFQNPPKAGNRDSGIALNAIGIKVDGSVLLSEGFSAVGSVKLVNARITTAVNCKKGSFESLDFTDAFAGAILDDEVS